MILYTTSKYLSIQFLKMLVDLYNKYHYLPIFFISTVILDGYMYLYRINWYICSIFVFSNMIFYFNYCTDHNHDTDIFI